MNFFDHNWIIDSSAQMTTFFESLSSNYFVNVKKGWGNLNSKAQKRRQYMIVWTKATFWSNVKNVFDGERWGDIYYFSKWNNCFHDRVNRTIGSMTEPCGGWEWFVTSERSNCD